MTKRPSTSSLTCWLVVLSSCSGAGSPPIREPVDEAEAVDEAETPPASPTSTEATEASAPESSTSTATPRSSETHRLEAELDGNQGAELVIVSREPRTDPEHCCTEPATDWVRVYSQEEGRLREVASLPFDATNDGGTFDYTPGISEIRAERPPGQDRDLLRLRTEAGQGGVDPRWIEVAETILRLEGDTLAALTCAVQYDTFSGPWRSMINSVQRTLTLAPTATSLTVRVDEHSVEPVYDGGLATDEEPIPSDQIERQRSTTYLLQNGRFTEQGSTGMCTSRVSTELRDEDR